MFFWVLVLFGTVIALFFGTAIVAGILESNEQADVKQKANTLTSIADLQKMVMTGMRKDPRPPLSCLYIGAIGFRLAESRDLKIPISYAIDPQMTNI